MIGYSKMWKHWWKLNNILVTFCCWADIIDVFENYEISAICAALNATLLPAARWRRSLVPSLRNSVAKRAKPPAFSPATSSAVPLFAEFEFYGPTVRRLYDGDVLPYFMRARSRVIKPRPSYWIEGMRRVTDPWYVADVRFGTFTRLWTRKRLHLWIWEGIEVVSNNS